MAKASEAAAASRTSASPAKAATTVKVSAPTVVRTHGDDGRPGADSLARARGVTDIFGLPGGAILPAYDPLLDSTILRHILVRHEQGAGHAAQGYAHATGRAGVAHRDVGPRSDQPRHAHRRREHGLDPHGVR